MQIHLIAIRNRMPSWVTQGYEDYAKRLPKECSLVLKEIPAGKRQKNSDLARITHAEGERMLAAIPKNALVVSLDLSQKQWSTEQLAERMQQWQLEYQHIALLVGGPEGLADACRAKARQTWCLSALTLPHPVVRIVVAEQIYRAWSILCNHPYHR